MGAMQPGFCQGAKVFEEVLKEINIEVHETEAWSTAQLAHAGDAVNSSLFLGNELLTRDAQDIAYRGILWIKKVDELVNNLVQYLFNIHRIELRLTISKIWIR